MKRFIVLLFCMMFSTSLSAFQVGDLVTPKEGPEKGSPARIIRIYTNDGVTSFGLEFSKSNFGLYRKENIEYHKSGIHSIIDEKKA